jgi:hypothetical protein
MRGGGNAVRAVFVGIKFALSIALVAIGTGAEMFQLRGKAFAQEDARSAKFILQSCQNFLAGDASVLPFLQGRCFGVIDGLAYGSPDICPPATTTGEEMVRAVVNYISVRPDRMREDFRVLALEALILQWPCK